MSVSYRQRSYRQPVPVEAEKLDPRDHTYFSATRHPLPSLLYLLPWLLAYEGSVCWLGGSDSNSLRNGADAWLHEALASFGLHEIFWAPLFLVAVLCGWCAYRRRDRPPDLIGVCSGMAIESIFAALGLWGLHRVLRPLLHGLAQNLEVTQALDGTTASLVSYIGAGIYEEVLFRLLLFTCLCWLLRLLTIPEVLVAGLAALMAALAFALAHHVGPSGEPYHQPVFLFRCCAGIYFTLIYRLRGFGIAVGAHACYDVFAGIAVG